MTSINSSPHVLTERVAYTALKSAQFVHVIIMLETWYSGGKGWISVVNVSHNLFQVGSFTKSNSQASTRCLDLCLTTRSEKLGLVLYYDVISLATIFSNQHYVVSAKLAESAKSPGDDSAYMLYQQQCVVISIDDVL